MGPKSVLKRFRGAAVLAALLVAGRAIASVPLYTVHWQPFSVPAGVTAYYRLSVGASGLEQPYLTTQATSASGVAIPVGQCIVGQVIDASGMPLSQVSSEICPVPGPSAPVLTLS